MVDHLMASSQTTDTRTTGSRQDFRKRRMGYALALSLVLHIGAGLVFIIAGGFGTGGKNTHNFMIQEVELTPSLSAPAKKEPAPIVPPPVTTSATPTKTLDTDQPAPEPAAEKPSEPSGNNEKAGDLMSTPLGLGMTYGYFSGLSDGRSLRDDIRGYYFEMVEKINREWWDKAGLIKEPLRQDGIFEVLVQRDGTIVSLRLLKGTGSSEADRVLAEIIRRASPLPPLPSTFDRSIFEAPLRIKVPSFLFR